MTFCSFNRLGSPFNPRKTSTTHALYMSGYRFCHHGLGCDFFGVPFPGPAKGLSTGILCKSPTLEETASEG